MAAAPEPTDRDAAEQQLRMELMTVQIDHGRLDMKHIEQLMKNTDVEIERAKNLYSLEIRKIVIAALAAGGALLGAGGVIGHFLFH